MSIKYLYYTEDTGTGGQLSAAFAVPGLDQILSMFGGERMAIHSADADYNSTASESFETLADAQAAYLNHTWIYLTGDAPTFLDELTPLPNDVVYVVGHDSTGFGGESLNGNAYKLRVLKDSFTGYALTILSTVAIDRWCRMQSWL